MSHFTNRITLLSSIFILLFATAYAQPVTLPRTPSPAASVSQTIGISTVAVSYSRPSVKGRNVWGGVVPYGWTKQPYGPGNSAPWRAGANENTVLTLSHTATVQGHTVPAGSYGLFFVINQDNTGELVLSKDYRSWGSFFYDEKLDELRAPVSIRDNTMTEMLTYDFFNTTKNSSELVLSWEKKQFPVKIEFAVDSIVMTNAEQELRSNTGFTPQGFISAANYALQNKINYTEALAWIDKALAQNKTFTAMNIKAGLLKATGKNAEATTLMKDATAIATEIELNQYGYQLMNDGDVESALGLFVANTQRNPKSANAWDSLGEAYATKGDKKNAITAFKKSLSLNPSENTRINSEKFLRQLGAM